MGFEGHVTAQLLTEEAAYFREKGVDADCLRINEKFWRKLKEETPYAKFISWDPRRFCNSTVILDNALDTWEFC
jgi:hypothetical protein